MIDATKPNVSVRAVIVKDNKILLVNGDGDKTFWCTPGGRIDYGEDLKAGTKREVLEETGLDVEVENAFAVSEFVLETKKFHNVDIFFRCTIKSGDISDEWKDIGGPVVERRFVTLEELKEMNVFPLWLKDGGWIKKPDTDIYRGQDRKAT